MALINKNFAVTITCLFLLLGTVGCYSFKGISISNEIKTYDVPFVEIQTSDAPVGVNQDFQDKLIDKISRESRLSMNSNDANVTFKCAITRYVVEAIAPSSNNNIDASRLVVGIRVDYKDNLDAKNNWSKTFSGNEEFATGTNLLAVQDELLNSIFDRMVEDIFDRAFTNW